MFTQSPSTQRPLSESLEDDIFSKSTSSPSTSLPLSLQTSDVGPPSNLASLDYSVASQQPIIVHSPRRTTFTRPKPQSTLTYTPSISTSNDTSTPSNMKHPNSHQLGHAPVLPNLGGSSSRPSGKPRPSPSSPSSSPSSEVNINHEHDESYDDSESHNKGSFVGAIARFVMGQFYSLPPVTRGLSLLVIVGGILGRVGLAAFFSLCPLDLAHSASPSLPFALLRLFFHSVLYPFFSPSFPATILALFGIVSLLGSIEHNRGSLHAFQAVALSLFLSPIIFLGLSTGGAILFPSVISHKTLVYGGTSATTGFCASGPDHLVFALLALHSMTTGTTYRSLPGVPCPLTSSMTVVVLSLIHALFWFRIGSNSATTLVIGLVTHKFAFLLSSPDQRAEKDAVLGAKLRRLALEKVYRVHPIPPLLSSHSCDDIHPAVHSNTSKPHKRALLGNSGSGISSNRTEKSKTKGTDKNINNHAPPRIRFQGERQYHALGEDRVLKKKTSLGEKVNNGTIGEQAGEKDDLDSIPRGHNCHLSSVAISIPASSSLPSSASPTSLLASPVDSRLVDTSTTTSNLSLQLADIDPTSDRALGLPLSQSQSESEGESYDEDDLNNGCDDGNRAFFSVGYRSSDSSEAYLQYEDDDDWEHSKQNCFSRFRRRPCHTCGYPLGNMSTHFCDTKDTALDAVKTWNKFMSKDVPDDLNVQVPIDPIRDAVKNISRSLLTASPSIPSRPGALSSPPVGIQGERLQNQLVAMSKVITSIDVATRTITREDIDTFPLDNSSSALSSTPITLTTSIPPINLKDVKSMDENKKDKSDFALDEIGCVGAMEHVVRDEMNIDTLPSHSSSHSSTTSHLMLPELNTFRLGLFPTAAPTSFSDLLASLTLSLTSGYVPSTLAEQSKPLEFGTEVLHIRKGPKAMSSSSLSSLSSKSSSSPITAPRVCPIAYPFGPHSPENLLLKLLRAEDITASPRVPIPETSSSWSLKKSAKSNSTLSSSETHSTTSTFVSPSQEDLTTFPSTDGLSIIAQTKLFTRAEGLCALRDSDHQLFPLFPSSLSAFTPVDTNSMSPYSLHPTHMRMNELLSLRRCLLLQLWMGRGFFTPTVSLRFTPLPPFTTWQTVEAPEEAFRITSNMRSKSNSKKGSSVETTRHHDSLCLVTPVDDLAVCTLPIPTPGLLRALNIGSTFLSHNHSHSRCRSQINEISSNSKSKHASTSTSTSTSTNSSKNPSSRSTPRASSVVGGTIDSDSVSRLMPNNASVASYGSDEISPLSSASTDTNEKEREKGRGVMRKRNQRTFSRQTQLPASLTHLKGLYQLFQFSLAAQFPIYPDGSLPRIARSPLEAELCFSPSASFDDCLDNVFNRHIKLLELNKFISSSTSPPSRTDLYRVPFSESYPSSFSTSPTHICRRTELQSPRTNRMEDNPNEMNRPQMNDESIGDTVVTFSPTFDTIDNISAIHPQEKSTTAPSVPRQPTQTRSAGRSRPLAFFSGPGQEYESLSDHSPSSRQDVRMDVGTEIGIVPGTHRVPQTITPQHALSRYLVFVHGVPQNIFSFSSSSSIEKLMSKAPIDKKGDEDELISGIQAVNPFQDLSPGYVLSNRREIQQLNSLVVLKGPSWGWIDE